MRNKVFHRGLDPALIKM